MVPEGPPSRETITATAQMQQQCVEAYPTVTASLRAGTTEAEIVRAELGSN